MLAHVRRLRKLLLQRLPLAIVEQGLKLRRGKLGEPIIDKEMVVLPKDARRGQLEQEPRQRLPLFSGKGDGRFEHIEGDANSRCVAKSPPLLLGEVELLCLVVR